MKQGNDKNSPQRCLIDLYYNETLDFHQRAALEKLEAAADGMAFEELLRNCREAGLPDIFQDYNTTELQLFATRLAAHNYAYKHYAALPISIPVHLFAAAERPLDPENQPKVSLHLGWNAVLPEQQIQRVQVPGNHQTMMDDPQIAVLGKALSNALAQASAGQQSCLPEMHYQPHVTIQTGNRSNIPIFCVPGAGDSVVGFFELASEIGDGWPLHGLQPRGVDGVLVPFSTVEAAAAAYVNEIKALYPEGTVHLLGHSFGGWVALEMAHQMCAMNRSVASLTIIDSEVPGGNGMIGREYTPTEILRKLIKTLELSAERSLGIDSSELDSLDEASQLELLHQGMVRLGLIHHRSPAGALRGVIRTFGAALRTNYQPRQLYLAPLRLVVVSDAELDDQTNRRKHHQIIEGWRQWAPNVSYWEGPGNHMTVLKLPQANAVARWWLAGLSPDGFVQTISS